MEEEAESRPQGDEREERVKPRGTQVRQHVELWVLCR